MIHILSLSNSHNNVASIQKNRGDKLHHVIVALGPFTSCSHRIDEDDYENANIWIGKPKWIDLIMQQYENGTIWKRIRVTGALVGGKFAIRTSSII